jgi:hypothetical protein
VNDDRRMYGTSGLRMNSDSQRRNVDNGDRIEGKRIVHATQCLCSVHDDLAMLIRFD